MELTRRQWIMGVLAAYGTVPAVRPLRPAAPGDTFWWLGAADLQMCVTDQSDVFAYGYLDDVGQWHHFAGDDARQELARQQAQWEARS